MTYTNRVSVAALVSVVASACDADPAPAEPRIELSMPLMAGVPERHDVLIVVDDSASMAPRQPQVARAVGAMLRRLVEPACVDVSGAVVEPIVYVDVLGRCPAGLVPEREPVRDMNVGVITTSLDAPGLDGCLDERGEPAPEQGDAAHLRFRGSDGIDVATWKNRGFVAWDRDQVRACDLYGGGHCPGLASADELAARVEAIVGGVGASGCGSTSPLEAAWRFLGDPAPYATLAAGRAEGVDEGLLAERAAFLGEGGWPSRVVVVIVSDGDDTSYRADAVGAYFADPASPMPRARAECEEDPRSECCASCIDPTPDGCTGDGGCEEPGCSDVDHCAGNFHAAGSPEQDPTTRCVDGRRRFGIDGCYPNERYVNAFTAARIDPARVDLAASADGGDGNALALHQPSLVAIVDVPWETIARRDASGAPDLERGLAGAQVPVGGYMDSSELDESGAWSSLLPPGPTVVGTPRRILEVTYGLGEVALLASIEPPTFEGDVDGRGLDVGFDAALQNVTRHRSLRPHPEWTLCGPDASEADASGAVACHVVEAWDSDRDRDATTTEACRCDAPGRDDVDEASSAAAARVREVLDVEEEEAHTMLMFGPGYDCLCVVPQLEGEASELGTPRNVCVEAPVPPLGVDGWCFASFASVSVAPYELQCGRSAQGVRLIGRGAPRPGSRTYLACE